ncbi:hypothetical protein BH20ACT5_BH20ACT5_10310 [soil metagenome]
MAFTDRLTKLATMDRRLCGVRNLLLRGLSNLPIVRTKLAWRLSGLVYRGSSTRGSE